MAEQNAPTPSTAAASPSPPLTRQSTGGRTVRRQSTQDRINHILEVGACVIVFAPMHPSSDLC